MTGPIIPIELWPEGAVALVWSAVGLGKWVTADSFTGTREVDLADVPMPAGWDWRVPVMRPQPAPAIDLERLVSLRNRLHAMACRVGPEWEAEAGELQRDVQHLIEGQAVPRGPDQPDLCDLCRVREEVRSDAEGVPFCQECWDGWQASKGEGE